MNNSSLYFNETTNSLRINEALKVDQDDSSKLKTTPYLVGLLNDINNCYCYQIIIFYDEISNESENIINEILDVLDKYNKRIDIQYDNDSAYISWY